MQNQFDFSNYPDSNNNLDMNTNTMNESNAIIDKFMSSYTKTPFGTPENSTLNSSEMDKNYMKDNDLSPQTDFAIFGTDVFLEINHCQRFKKSKLELKQNYLKELPDLRNFTWVKVLNLAGNCLTNIDVEKLPPNLIKLNIKNNNITNQNFDNFPESLEIMLASGNQLESFDGTKLKNLKQLTLMCNKISDFKFPPNIMILNLSNNKLESLEKFPESLKKIDCSSNLIRELPEMNDKLIKINIEDNHLKEIKNLPPNLIKIKCGRNMIDKVVNLPSSLQKINLENNSIEKLDCVLPPSVVLLDMSGNNLIELPDLPNSIEFVDVCRNHIKKLKDVPESVKILDFSDNFIDEIPESLVLRAKYSDIRLITHNNYFDSNKYNFNQGASQDDFDSISLFDNDYGIKDYSSNNYSNNYHYLRAMSDHSFRNFSRDNYMNRYNDTQNISNRYNEKSKISNRYEYSSFKTSSKNPNYISINNKKHIKV